MFITDPSLLPPRIISVLKEVGEFSTFRGGLKTALKPNSTIPLLWLISTETHLLICNTHRTRGLYRKYTWPSINEIRKVGGSMGLSVIEIIHQGINTPDEKFPLNQATPLKEINAFLESCGSTTF